MNSTLVLLDAVVHLAWDKSERDDTGDVHLRAEHLHGETELYTDGLDVLKTFLVVRTSTTNPDLNLVLNKERGDFTESTNDTLECRSDLCAC